MPTLTELTKERAQIVQSAEAINDAAKTEDRDLTDDEAVKFDGFLTRAEDLETRIAAKHKQLDNHARMVALRETVDAPTEPAYQDLAPTAQSGPSIHVGEPNVRNDPDKGFKTAALFLNGVLEACREGRITQKNEGLRFLMAIGSDEQSTFSDPHGGFLVPKTLAPGILATSPEADPMGGLTTKIPMASPSVTFNARVDKSHATSVSGGLVVTRTPESDAASSSRMSFEQIELKAVNLFGLAYATEQILVDSPQSFAAMLSQAFGDQFQDHLVEERLNGTGTGEFLGVMNSACLVSVAKESGQSADTIVTANITKMMSRCWGFEKAIWIANQNTFPQLASLVDAGNNSLFLNRITETAPAQLLGRPIVFSEHAATIGDKGDIVLGNWSQYLEGTIGSLQSAESIHVRFVNHERTFKFWLRNDGRPWWGSALTPKRGSTLSPFVTLDARA